MISSAASRALAGLDHVVPLAARRVGEDFGLAGEEVGEEAHVVRVVGDHQEVERARELRRLAARGRDLLAAGEAIGVARAEPAPNAPASIEKRGVQVRVAEERPRREVAAGVGRVGALGEGLRPRPPCRACRRPVQARSPPCRRSGDRESASEEVWPHDLVSLTGVGSRQLDRNLQSVAESNVHDPSFRRRGTTSRAAAARSPRSSCRPRARRSAPRGPERDDEGRGQRDHDEQRRHDADEAQGAQLRLRHGGPVEVAVKEAEDESQAGHPLGPQARLRRDEPPEREEGDGRQAGRRA